MGKSRKMQMKKNEENKDETVVDSKSNFDF